MGKGVEGEGKGRKIFSELFINGYFVFNNIIDAELRKRTHRFLSSNCSKACCGITFRKFDMQLDRKQDGRL